MSKIQKLDEHLTNMIAAGEVVERPMGVIKELVENAIDAKASKITVSIEEGGIEVIEVNDDGEGMDAQDALLAFNRHSTSKIIKESDLWRISSLGFRGEALPSIASVAEVLCLTNNGIETTKVQYAYGQLVSASQAAGNKGTTMRVTNLFQKTPARLKHLKSIPYETSLILDVIQKFALSYPSIAFSLRQKEKQLFQTSGNGDLKEVVYLIYGHEVAQHLLTFEEQNFDFKISGVLVLPQFNRSSRHSISVFMNNRVVRYIKAQNAVNEGYRRHLPIDRYPMAVLKIEMDHQLIDVNVHPSKWEIRLSKEKELIELIIATVQTTLNEYMKPKTLTIPIQEKVEYFAQESLDMYQPVTEVKVSPLVNDLKPLTVEETPKTYPIIEEIESTPQTETIKTQVVEEKPVVSEEPSETQTVEKREANRELMELEILAQMHGKYILAQGTKGLYLFDQHASMERIRYEYYQQLLLEKQHDKQPLLLGIVFERKQGLIDRLDELNQYLSGFDIHLEALSDDQLILREIPTWMQAVDLKLALNEFLESFEYDQHLNEEKFRRRMLATMACHSSIRFNHYLTQAEMIKIVHDLALCEQPFHCPHGRPTFMIVENSMLEREFGR